jgi:hypothetical protein
MSESVIAWSFLVARGRHRGYRTLLAPGFLTERRLHGLLSDSANGERMDASRAREVEVEGPEVGALTLVYRSEQVTEAEIGDGGEHDLATDEHGRPLEILYGIVCRGRLRGRVDDDDLGSARREALESYRRFLAEEDGFGVDDSNAFALRGVTPAPEAPLPPPAPAPARRDRLVSHGSHRRIAAAAVVVALAALAVAIFPRGGSAPIVDVRASMVPSTGIVDCNRPTTFLLQGAIETDGEAEVVYHWETQGWRGPSSRLVLEQAGWQQLPPERHQAAGLPDQGYALVVEQPDRSRTRAGRAPRCVAEPALTRSP